MKSAVSPAAFSVDGERFVLHFRPADEGDLGLVKCILRGDLYEPEVVACLKRILAPDGVLIDGGAHIGYVSLAASRFLRQGEGKVFSFEPFRESCDFLRLNIEANGKASMIQAYPLALWSSSGGVDLAVPENCSVSVKRGDACLTPGVRRVRVESIDLDSFCCGAGIVPSLIKLDIEGSEHEALRGAARILSEHRPAVVLELNAHHYRTLGMTIEGFLSPLLKTGYGTCYILSSRPGRIRAFRASDGWGTLEKSLKDRHLNCLFMPDDARRGAMDRDA